MNQQARAATAAETDSIARRVDDEPVAANQRVFGGGLGWAGAALCVLSTGFQIGVMTLCPLEPWVHRLSHVAGGRALGFVLFASRSIRSEGGAGRLTRRRSRC
jgi:hypothetical protein